jgi:uncharacterized DUF497 family protein
LAITEAGKRTGRFPVKGHAFRFLIFVSTSAGAEDGRMVKSIKHNSISLYFSHGYQSHTNSHIKILTHVLSCRNFFLWKNNLGVSFALAQLAFLDHNRVVLEDLEHSGAEKRYYCLGRVAGGIMTVRFSYRNNKIRIIGAGFWRKGKKIYEKENKIHG